MITEKKMLKARIKSLQKCRKDTVEEFGDYPTFYTIQWFLNQLKEIDKQIEKFTQQLKGKQEKEK